MRKRHGEAFSSFTQYVAATQFWYCNATKSMGTVREWFLLFWHLKGCAFGYICWTFSSAISATKSTAKVSFLRNVLSCHLVVMENFVETYVRLSFTRKGLTWSRACSQIGQNLQPNFYYLFILIFNCNFRNIFKFRVYSLDFICFKYFLRNAMCPTF